jgi:hypothetical protein
VARAEAALCAAKPEHPVTPVAPSSEDGP